MDNEFYFVTFEDFMGRIRSVTIHLRNGEKLSQYMYRVYAVKEENIHCIYKRIFAK